MSRTRKIRDQAYHRRMSRDTSRSARRKRAKVNDMEQYGRALFEEYATKPVTGPLPGPSVRQHEEA